MPDSDGYVSDLARELAADALERFLRYVRIDTQSDPHAGTYPSTEKQLDLSRLLVDELRAIGLEDAELTEGSVVMATIPATTDREVPAFGLIAHVDTSPELSGANVRPQVVRYEGGELPLPGDPQQVLRPDDLPELADHVGHELVTSDGTTLLGADNKAGVAEIVAAAAYLVAHPEIEHGPIRIGFTPDEEIGAGTDGFDIERFGAVAAYTLDGSTAGEIEDETFAALQAEVTFHGRNTHPGTAKDVMVNAIKLAADFVASLPRDRLSPETTDDRDGFVHPIEFDGSVDRSTVRLILRDFDEELLAGHERLVRELAERAAAGHPHDVQVKRQYRNMKEYLREHPHVVAAAEEATRRAGLDPRRNVIRGGTDGSRLSEKGLPTPNVFTGGQAYHSKREWVCVADMGAAAATVVHLAQVWAEAAAPSRSS
ncbi:MAG TPA: peptidase T [Gaiellaceae bacterium]|nr:peptidase T [Gaiellaceae bacterium]